MTALMRTARQSTRFVLVAFALVAAMVLAGMTWATVVTVRLERVAVEQEARAAMDSRVRLALWRLDNYMTSVLASEAGRPYTNYVPFYRPADVWNLHGQPLSPGAVVLPSPLLTAEPHPWIELHFQVDPNGEWTSPEVLDENTPWMTPEMPVVDAERMRKIRHHLVLLSESLTLPDLQQQVAQAKEQKEQLFGSEGDDLVVHAPRADRPKYSEYNRRGRSQVAAQLRALPVTECDPAEIVTANIQNRALEPTTSDTEPEQTQALSVIEVSPLTTTWLQAACESCARLAFVRTVTVDGMVSYQGFAARWENLEPILLDQIADLFPEADLHPVADRSQIDERTVEHMMSTIDVELVPPEEEALASATAWHHLQPTLLITWTVTLLVLATAAIGVRNLLVLTERRRQFAYAVTHELRTPLTTFRLYADMLAAGLVPDESRQQYLDTLNREAGRLSEVVESVLDFARVENQKVPLNPTSVDGRRLLDLMTEPLTQRCAASGVDLRVDSTVAPERELRTDVDLLRQVVSVLVSNACRHAGKAERREVQLHVSGPDGQVQVDVIDTGPGVDGRDRRHIFKPFRRGRGAAASAAGGIGLGLALARSWTHLLGGRLELVTGQHPDLGGAHFRVSVPNLAKS